MLSSFIPPPINSSSFKTFNRGGGDRLKKRGRKKKGMLNAMKRKMGITIILLIVLGSGLASAGWFIIQTIYQEATVKEFAEMSIKTPLNGVVYPGEVVDLRWIMKPTTVGLEHPEVEVYFNWTVTGFTDTTGWQICLIVEGDENIGLYELLEEGITFNPSEYPNGVMIRYCGVVPPLGINDNKVSIELNMSRHTL